MNKFKEISLILLSVVLMFGGLGVIMTAELANGIMLVGGLMILAGICILVYLVKDAWSSGREEENPYILNGEELKRTEEARKRGDRW